MPTLKHPTQPIKVMHIASGDRWAGAEVQLWTLVRHLNRRDEVRARAVLLNEGETAERLRASGVPVDVLDEARLNALQILLGLRRLIRRHRPDVIHTHRQKENVLGSLANATTLRVPSVRTVHGAAEHAPPWSKPHKRLFNWLDLAVGRYLQDRIIAVSGDLGDQLKRCFSVARVTVIENGVDVDMVKAQAREPADFRTMQPHHKHIGIVGRLDPVKRVDIFLDMAADLTKRTLPWPVAFHVFGDGPLKNSLVKMTHDLGLDDLVTFHGQRKDIHPCIGSLDIMIMCSDHEGMPMAALEAVALDTHIIANRVGGLITAIVQGSTGTLLQSRAPAAYADAVIKQLCVSDNAPSARETKQNNPFTAETNAKQTAALYRNLMSAKPQHHAETSYK